jgi:putative sigma-54 modulation protein
MEFHIKGHDVPIGDNLRALIGKKTARLDRYLPAWAVIDAKIDLHERNGRGGTTRLVELTVATRGAMLRAEASAPDFSAALDEAVDRLARRIVRYRSRWRDARRHVAGEPALPELPAEADAFLPDESEAPAALIRVKRFPVKPMEVEEAIDQMDLLGHDLFVFINVDGQETNVVYRRRDGGYGLIQPERA